MNITTALQNINTVSVLNLILLLIIIGLLLLIISLLNKKNNNIESTPHSSRYSSGYFSDNLEKFLKENPATPTLQ